jgi:flagellar hook-associated protein 1
VALFNMTATASGAASALTVNPTVTADPSLLAAATTAAGAPGDGGNLQAIIATEDQALSGRLNVKQSLAKIVSDFGVSAQSAKDAASFDGAVLQHLKDARESASGVSTDDEMVSLTRAQHSYEAMSKVITTANAMLDTLMSLVS